MYKLGDMDRAFYVFSRVEELYGAQGFKGEQKAYLESSRKTVISEAPLALDGPIANIWRTF